MKTFHKLTKLLSDYLPEIIMHSWRLRSLVKWITLTLLMAIIARLKADHCVKRAYEPIYEGQSCIVSFSCVFALSSSCANILNF
jgi:hypothetical protein